MHHRGAFILFDAAGGTGTVLAAQRQVHVVPARIVLAQVLAAGIEQHDALGIGNVDAVADLVLGQAPDLRAGAAQAIRLEHLRQAALGKGAGLDVIVQDLGQQVGSVYQGFLGRLAYHGANLLAHRIEQEVTRQADEQEVHQKDPNAQAHHACSGL
ncbi:hypothetical protein D3C79_641770 [compost metagenome]